MPLSVEHVHADNRGRRRPYQQAAQSRASSRVILSFLANAQQRLDVAKRSRVAETYSTLYIGPPRGRANSCKLTNPILKEKVSDWYAEGREKVNSGGKFSDVHD